MQNRSILKKLVRPFLFPIAELLYNIVKKYAPQVLHDDSEYLFYKFKQQCELLFRNLKKERIFLEYITKYQDKVEKFKTGLDQQSIELLNCSINRLKTYPIDVSCHNVYTIKNMTEDEIFNEKKWNEIEKKYRNKYHFINHVCATDFYFNYGLIFLPNDIVKNLNNGIFFDCGAYDGATSIMMKNFSPQKIYAFEISKKTIMLYKKNMELANIPESLYEIVNAGTSDQCKTSFINDTAGESTSLKDTGPTQIEEITLDSFIKNKSISKVSWIKADIEGYAINMIKGAVELLKRDTPILTLGVYHTPEELFECKLFIESLNLGYKFILRKITTERIYLTSEELCLIAWKE